MAIAYKHRSIRHHVPRAQKLTHIPCSTHAQKRQCSTSVCSRLSVDNEVEDRHQELIGQGRAHPRVVVVRGRQAACGCARMTRSAKVAEQARHRGSPRRRLAGQVLSCPATAYRPPPCRPPCSVSHDNLSHHYAPLVQPGYPSRSPGASLSRRPAGSRKSHTHFLDSLPTPSPRELRSGPSGRAGRRVHSLPRRQRSGTATSRRTRRSASGSSTS
jgi:hypothetical protein